MTISPSPSPSHSRSPFDHHHHHRLNLEVSNHDDEPSSSLKDRVFAPASRRSTSSRNSIASISSPDSFRSAQSRREGSPEVGFADAGNPNHAHEEQGRPTRSPYNTRSSLSPERSRERRDSYIEQRGQVTTLTAPAMAEPSASAGRFATSTPDRGSFYPSASPVSSSPAAAAAGTRGNRQSANGVTAENGFYPTSSPMELGNRAAEARRRLKRNQNITAGLVPQQVDWESSQWSQLGRLPLESRDIGGWTVIPRPLPRSPPAAIAVDGDSAIAGPSSERITSSQQEPYTRQRPLDIRSYAGYLKSSPPRNMWSDSTVRRKLRLALDKHLAEPSGESASTAAPILCRPLPPALFEIQDSLRSDERVDRQWVQRCIARGLPDYDDELEEWEQSEDSRSTSIRRSITTLGDPMELLRGSARMQETTASMPPSRRLSVLPPSIRDSIDELDSARQSVEPTSSRLQSGSAATSSRGESESSMDAQPSTWDLTGLASRPQQAHDRSSQGSVQGNAIAGPSHLSDRVERLNAKAEDVSSPMRGIESEPPADEKPRRGRGRPTLADETRGYSFAAAPHLDSDPSSSSTRSTRQAKGKGKAKEEDGVERNDSSGSSSIAVPQPQGPRKRGRPRKYPLPLTLPLPVAVPTSVAAAIANASVGAAASASASGPSKAMAGPLAPEAAPSSTAMSPSTSHSSNATASTSSSMARTSSSRTMDAQPLTWDITGWDQRRVASEDSESDGGSESGSRGEAEQSRSRQGPASNGIIEVNDSDDDELSLPPLSGHANGNGNGKGKGKERAISLDVSDPVANVTTGATVSQWTPLMHSNQAVTSVQPVPRPPLPPASPPSTVLPASIHTLSSSSNDPSSMQKRKRPTGPQTMRSGPPRARKSTGAPFRREEIIVGSTLSPSDSSEEEKEQGDALKIMQSDESHKGESRNDLFFHPGDGDVNNGDKDDINVNVNVKLERERVKKRQRLSHSMLGLGEASSNGSGSAWGASKDSAISIDDDD